MQKLNQKKLNTHEYLSLVRLNLHKTVLTNPNTHNSTPRQPTRQETTKKSVRSNKRNFAVLTRPFPAKVSWMENYKVLCTEIRKDFITRALLRFLNNFQNSHKLCRAPLNCCFCLLIEANNFEKLKIKEKKLQPTLSRI